MPQRSSALLAATIVVLLICGITFCLAVGVAGVVGWFVASNDGPLPSAGAPTGVVRTATPAPSDVVPRTPTPRSSSANTPTPGQSATVRPGLANENLAAVLDTVPPSRDLMDLARRLGQIDPSLAATPPAAPTRTVGQVETFWVSDQDRNEHFVVTATLRFAGENSYFYVDNAVTYDAARLKDAAEVFDQRTFPQSLRIFGDHWKPGPDGDRRLTVLNTLTPGAGGYYSSADEFPRAVNRYSNQRKMIYIDVKSYPVSSARYGGVLAHELQHAIQWVADPAEEGWVSEGLSELAMRLNGFSASRTVQAFAEATGTQLNTWGDGSDGNAAHYGASYAFLSYFYERFGEDALRALASHPERGILGFDSVIAAYDPGATFRSVFSDWVIANYLDDLNMAGGNYGHAALDPRVVSLDAASSLPGTYSDQVGQFGARYLQFVPPDFDFTIAFSGATFVPLLGPQAHGGDYFWWGNRGDNTDSHLTREFDLTGIVSPALTYWTWYDIEQDWDYAFLLVSTDDGGSWTTVKASRTTDTDPIGHNYGHGYTGESAGWVQERAELTPFAGQSVLVRFEYITDDAVNNPGFAVDDICLLPTGVCDNAEGIGSWQAQGFVRASTWLPQDFEVQVIRTIGQKSVQRIAINAGGVGTLSLPGRQGSADRVVIAISGVTPVTTESVPYTITVAK